jgi:hypothetical protein
LCLHYLLEFDPEVLFVNEVVVALFNPEVVEFVLDGVVVDDVEFDCENAEIAREPAKTVLNTATIKIIPRLIFVLLLLINYILF